MIRFLQKDTPLVKGIFYVIVGAAILTMVVFLVPGLLDNDTTGANSNIYATVHQLGLMGRLGIDSMDITRTEVDNLVQRQMEQQQQQLPPSLIPLFEQQAAQYLVAQNVLQHQADKMGLQVSDADLSQELKTGQLASYIFPGGKYIGDTQYATFIDQAFHLSVADFEAQMKRSLELARLQQLVTGGITVSDNTVRAEYMKTGTKVKFDYAVISADDLRKQVNPSDADLQAFFKQNAARYATADPETRKVQYVAFDANSVPGKVPVTDTEVQNYYNSHKSDYTQPEQVQTRHILITSPQGADAKTDAAAKAKAEDVLKQLKAGGNFAELAKKYSDDPGSKANGGDLPMMPTSGFVPEFSKAAMALNPGQTSDLVKTQFGYHIIQTIAKQPAGTKPLAEVKDQISSALTAQKNAAALQSFQQKVASQAGKDGLDKTAAAYQKKAETTDYIARTGQVNGLADSAALLTQAFTAAKGAAPATVSTGDGFAVFQVVDVKAAHAPSFDEYKGHILEDYREQKTPELLNTQLSKLADRAKVLNDLKKAAAEMNVPLKSSDLVGRTDQVPLLGAMSGQASVAFTLAKGALSGPINTGTAGVVLVVTDKQEPSADDIAKNFQQTREQLVGQKQQETFQLFEQTLVDQYEKAGAVRYSASAKAPALPSGN